MENSNLNYVKTIIRSVVTSTPNNMTIEQVLLDYVDLEGVSVPYKKLGFETVFELLETMNDVLLVSLFEKEKFIVLLIFKRTANYRF